MVRIDPFSTRSPQATQLIKFEDFITLGSQPCKYRSCRIYLFLFAQQKTTISSGNTLCLLPTAYVIGDGRLCFQSVHTWGRRVPHLHPITLPLVLSPFQGEGYPSSSHNTSTGPMSFPGGYPSDWSQVRMWGSPSQVRRGVPHYGVPPFR